MTDIVATAIEAARAAGAFLRENARGDMIVRQKEDKSLVTDLDRAAEQSIVDVVRSRYPNHGVVGEESGRFRGDAEYIWVIDPLDGTHNYIRGLPLYGVSIGVMRGEDHVAGVIYMPAQDSLYAAEDGAGAYLNGERIHVSTIGELSGCSLSCDSGIRRAPDQVLGTLSELGTRVFNVRMFGASTVLLSALAEGRIDVAVEFGDALWDYAAGVCLVREAGGKFTSLDGGAVSSTDTAYVASNGLVHDEAVQILGGVGNR